MRSVLARFNFSCNMIGNHPQSLTSHTATVVCDLNNSCLIRLLVLYYR
jgi:hypothetical protein